MNTSAKWPHFAGWGPIPGEAWVSSVAPDGDAQPWKSAPVGQEYLQKDTTNNRGKLWIKRENQGQDADWSLSGLGVVQFTFTRAAMTDGGSTAGTYTYTGEAIPAGAVVARTQIVAVTGFTGDTSAVMIVGDGTDTDRYNTSTVNVFATATHLDAGVPSGTAFHSAAKDVVVTITSAADFTNVAAGQATIRIWYYR